MHTCGAKISRIWFCAIISLVDCFRYVPEPAQFQVVGRFDLLDFLLETVDGFDERRAVLSGAAAQFLDLEDDIAETIVQTDHILLLSGRRHEQAAKRVRTADVMARRTLTVNKQRPLSSPALSLLRRHHRRRRRHKICTIRRLHKKIHVARPAVPCPAPHCRVLPPANLIARS